MMKRISSLFWLRSYGPAAGVFLLALLVRIAYNLVNARGYQPVYDAGIYEHIARNLLDYHCYCVHGQSVSVSRAPLWPWIIATLYLVGWPGSSAAASVLLRAWFWDLSADLCLGP
ncbi:hypothetical protein KDW_61160 [Dictyobacter vulcani]|uniref:Glycosyltransferase RgtA/B/C/D-like domain-containing protein n=1 Tax=Dictyobacter vulcani TaxID=2607529 RepID=A0A5J4KRF6_9CHLR|nr:hypothetical protein [Dictyobacter vulcani]GER91954.1 hypothetical protein KDW_61160 [Dictyobacter vulcani]